MLKRRIKGQIRIILLYFILKCSCIEAIKELHAVVTDVKMVRLLHALVTSFDQMIRLLIKSTARRIIIIIIKLGILISITSFILKNLKLHLIFELLKFTYKFG